MNTTQSSQPPGLPGPRSVPLPVRCVAAGKTAWHSLRHPVCRAAGGRGTVAAPRPVRAWDGIRKALSFGPPPPQDPVLAKSAADLPKGDDWLTVNVWTPDPGPAARRPVMVWIYGGGYELGFSGGYDASKIARAGGWWWSPSTTGRASRGTPRSRGRRPSAACSTRSPPCTGYETTSRPSAATRTRSPPSASRPAGAVATLLATPSAVGLFSRGIIESLPGTFFSDELAADIAVTMAAEVGRRPTAADLSVVDPRQLPAAGADLAAKISRYAGRWGPLAQANRIFAPVVDGEVLPTTPWQALEGGAAREVELIVGHNREEYRFFMVLGGKVGKISDEQAIQALGALAPGPDGEHAYRQAYPGVSAEQLFQLVQSDWQYRMPALHLADAQAAGGGRVHLYELTWPAPAAATSTAPATRSR